MQILPAEVALFFQKDPRVGTLDMFTQQSGISWDCNDNSNTNDDGCEDLSNMFVFQALC